VTGPWEGQEAAETPKYRGIPGHFEARMSFGTLRAPRGNLAVICTRLDDHEAAQEAYLFVAEHDPKVAPLLKEQMDAQRDRHHDPAALGDPAPAP
jgi:hypothetical protein